MHVFSDLHQPPAQVLRLHLPTYACRNTRPQRPPPTLLLHLKRFQPDARGRLNKVDVHVPFDPTLDIRWEGEGGGGGGCGGFGG